MDIIPFDTVFRKRNRDSIERVSLDALHHGHTLWAEVPGQKERQPCIFDKPSRSIVTPETFFKLKEARAAENRAKYPWHEIKARLADWHHRSLVSQPSRRHVPSAGTPERFELADATLPKAPEGETPDPIPAPAPERTEAVRPRRDRPPSEDGSELRRAFKLRHA